MFHVQQTFKWFKNQPIDELLFYIFVISIPLQLRLLLNADEAYIGYYFSYHKAIFVYLSDITFVCFILAYLLFSKDGKHGVYFALLPLIYCIFQLFHVQHIDLALYGALKVLEFWLILAYLMHKPHLFKPTALIILYSGIAQSLVGIIQFHKQSMVGLELFGEYVPNALQAGAAIIETSSGKLLRAYGTMPHPNVFGGFLATSYGLLLFVSRETKSLNRIVIVSCGTFILLWGLLLSFSRSAWLSALVMTMLISIWLIRRKLYLKFAILVIIIIVSCGTLAILYKTPVFERISDISVSSQAATDRADYNSFAWDIILKNNLFGVGPNQYIPTLQINEPKIEPWQNQPAHNIYVHYLAEWGIIGVLLTIYAIYKLCFTWNINKTLTMIVVPGILVLTLLDHYLITIQQGQLLFAVILGLLFMNKLDVSHSETSIVKK